MVLEGVVTNVTAFGAFVDIGVHQDGLVHVSQLAERFVEGPDRGREGRREAEGARARGRLERKRIALSMRADAGAQQAHAAERGTAPVQQLKGFERTALEPGSEADRLFLNGKR